MLLTRKPAVSLWMKGHDFVDTVSGAFSVDVDVTIRENIKSSGNVLSGGAKRTVRVNS